MLEVPSADWVKPMRLACEAFSAWSAMFAPVGSVPDRHGLRAGSRRDPSFLFLDEIDALPDRAALSGDKASWWTPLVTHVLLTLDAALAGTAAPICVIGATFRGQTIGVRKLGSVGPKGGSRAPPLARPMIPFARSFANTSETPYRWARGTSFSGGLSWTNVGCIRSGRQPETPGFTRSDCDVCWP